MSNELRDKGIEMANEAVNADKAEKHEEAKELYLKAIEYLMTAIKYEKNPVTIKTIREKVLEYTTRAEAIAAGLNASKNPKPKKAGGAPDEEEKDDDDDDDVEPEPLTEEQLKAAEAEMEQELEKLVGMASVKDDMRKLCKQLALDIKRRQEGKGAVDAIRHMMFTGNPGVGKTTVSRLVARLYKQLGVSSKETVVEVQKGDLVAGYVNQTSIKTAKKIKEARGGILFVDEAYQLTQALQKGQADFSGEAIDEMMKVMNDAGRKATTFVFAGYKKEMDEFVQYNAGLESRIKYRFHFDDYTVPELVTIIGIKMKKDGYMMDREAEAAIESIIEKNTTKEMRSRYNGRLTDNLLQWARDEMNSRLDANSHGDELVTYTKADFEAAIKKFSTNRPREKLDPSLLGGQEVFDQLKLWDLHEYAPVFIKHGYKQKMDLILLKAEADIKALGVVNEPDLRRAMQMVERCKAQHREISREMDKMYIDDEMPTIEAWLQANDLEEHAPTFREQKVDFVILGDLTYDDLKEMGFVDIGSRRKIDRAIKAWKEKREYLKADAIKAKMSALNEAATAHPPTADAARYLMGMPPPPTA